MIIEVNNNLITFAAANINLTMKNFVLRSISGIIYVALIVGALAGGLVWSTALFSIFCVLAMLEFQRITMGAVKSGADIAARALDIIVALAMCNIVYLLEMPTPIAMLSICIAFGYAALRFTIALYDKSDHALADTSWSALSMFYIAAPLMMLGLLCSEQSGWKIVLTMFAIIWLNDTGAYCVGSLIGRKRLFPRLSPKKSWEGFFGGLAFCLAAGVGASYIIGEPFNMVEWLGFGAMVCVLSTWGDLFESLIKRTNHIKDSGNIIPGHGGILDRIDSMLFASVGVFVVLFCVDML